MVDHQKGIKLKDLTFSPAELTIRMNLSTMQKSGVCFFPR